MPATIQPGATFTDNLRQLPPVGGVERIDLVDMAGAVVASIENQPGKQGSLAVYHSPSTRPTRAAAPARIPMSTACWRSPRVVRR
jgi:hypothetical protein